MPHVPDTVPGKACHRRRSAYGRPRPAVKHPRWEPYAGKLPVRFCAGAPSNGCPYRNREMGSGGLDVAFAAEAKYGPLQPPGTVFLVAARSLV